MVTDDHLREIDGQLLLGFASDQKGSVAATPLWPFLGSTVKLWAAAFLV